MTKLQQEIIRLTVDHCTILRVEYKDEAPISVTVGDKIIEGNEEDLIQKVENYLKERNNGN